MKVKTPFTRGYLHMLRNIRVCVNKPVHNTVKMHCQYPPSANCRRALAAYIVNDLHVNPMAELIPALVGTHKPQHANGMLTVGRIAFPANLVDNDAPNELSETAFVSLVIHSLVLVAPFPVVASFAQSEHLQHPTNLLRAEVWKHLAFLHIAPQHVATALTCQRPDMIHAVQVMYGNWLRRCRSPKHISRVLHQVVNSPWHIVSESKSCQVLTQSIVNAQVAVRPVKHLSHADIVVDNRAGLIISHRDKCFLALFLLQGPQSALVCTEITAFCNAKEDTPGAFAELSFGSHPLDEIINKEHFL